MLGETRRWALRQWDIIHMTCICGGVCLADICILVYMYEGMYEEQKGHDRLSWLLHRKSLVQSCIQMKTGTGYGQPLRRCMDTNPSNTVTIEIRACWPTASLLNTWKNVLQKFVLNIKQLFGDRLPAMWSVDHSGYSFLCRVVISALEEHCNQFWQESTDKSHGIEPC